MNYLVIMEHGKAQLFEAEPNQAKDVGETIAIDNHSSWFEIEQYHTEQEYNQLQKKFEEFFIRMLMTLPVAKRIEVYKALLKVGVNNE
ncbi:MAG: hypothetical protein ACI4UK_11385 [Floccifex sp.]